MMLLDLVVPLGGLGLTAWMIYHGMTFLREGSRMAETARKDAADKTAAVQAAVIDQLLRQQTAILESPVRQAAALRAVEHPDPPPPFQSPTVQEHILFGRSFEHGNPDVPLGLGPFEEPTT